MAKISELSDGGSLQSTDFLIAVRSGGNVKVQADGNLSLGTVTADGLTVDTDTLVVDATNNRVGIGTASPSALLNVAGASGDPVLLFTRTDNVSGNGHLRSAGNTGTVNAEIQLGSGSDDVIRFATSGGVATNERLRIDSSGNVGIGTASPSNELHVYASSGGATLKIESNPANAYDSSKLELLGGNLSTSEILLGDASVADVGKIIYRHDGNSLAFNVASAERMRIDSSGNLLVATTDDVVWNNSANSAADNGHNLRDDGRAGFAYYNATANANATVNVNRTGSDGDLIRLFKSGSTVGSIGTAVGYLTAGTGDTGLLFNSADDAVQPWNISANSARDALIDIGRSTHRFKDLYLSGGAYLGGTGAANHLDDYEEGTFTPTAIGTTTAGTGTYVRQTGRYTKVGNLVHVQITIGWSAHTGTGDLRITGLPFTSVAGLAGQSGLAIHFNNGLTHGSGTTFGVYVGGGGTTAVFTESTASGVLSNIAMDTAVSELILSGAYHAA